MLTPFPLVKWVQWGGFTSVPYENVHFKVKLLALSPQGGWKGESALTSVYTGSTELWENIWPHTERTNTNRAHSDIERNPYVSSHSSINWMLPVNLNVIFSEQMNTGLISNCAWIHRISPSPSILTGCRWVMPFHWWGVWCTHPPAILSLFPAQSPRRNRHMVSGGKVR